MFITWHLVSTTSVGHHQAIVKVHKCMERAQSTGPKIAAAKTHRRHWYFRGEMSAIGREGRGVVEVVVLDSKRK